MSTPRLLWGMTARGAGWTLPVGAILGAVYSVFVIGFLFFLGRNTGGVNGQPPPPAAMLLSMAIILAIGGGIVGGLIGIVFGPIGGLLCALMTRLFFSPQAAAARYNRATGVTGALYGLLATPLGLWIISGFNVAPPTGEAGNALLFYILPSLIGVAAGLFISRQIADWYREASAQRRVRETQGQLAPAQPVAP